MSDTPKTDAAVFTVDVAFVSHDGLASEPEEVVEPDFARQLERENAALRELLNEPYQFFRFGHKALFPWGKFLDGWCKRAEKLGFRKEAKP